MSRLLFQFAHKQENEKKYSLFKKQKGTTSFTFAHL